MTAWEEEYRSRQPAFTRLAAEIQFALQETTRRAGIKTHSVTSRVKSVESVADKARRKEYDQPLGQVDDLVGIRVVALFLSDLPRLDELIRSSFEIRAADDRVSGGDPATFGYMSMHYLAVLDSQHSGPRYDDLKGIQFEIQTRTVVMDAWANVSHYLDYKGESSIPEDLRRDFFALSGLFYVADQHFEIFADRSRQSQKQAEREVGVESAQSLEVNLDTMAAYLTRRYPDRRVDGRPDISELVEEISIFGYQDFDTLGEALNRGDQAFSEYEVKYPPGPIDEGRRFTCVGAVRMTLSLVDLPYAEFRGHLDGPVREFALWGGEVDLLGPDGDPV